MQAKGNIVPSFSIPFEDLLIYLQEYVCHIMYSAITQLSDGSFSHAAPTNSDKEMHVSFNGYKSSHFLEHVYTSISVCVAEFCTVDLFCRIVFDNSGICFSKAVVYLSWTFFIAIFSKDTISIHSFKFKILFRYRKIHFKNFMHRLLKPKLYCCCAVFYKLVDFLAHSNEYINSNLWT